MSRVFTTALLRVSSKSKEFMIIREPQPTADQLDKARLMLAAMERLFEAGGENAYAAVIREVLRGETSVLETWLTSGNFWGGMGSMIDCPFCTSTFRGREVDERNRREFRSLIIKLGKHQLVSGIFTPNIKPHIEEWTSIFEGWLGSNVI